MSTHLTNCESEAPGLVEVRLHSTPFSLLEYEPVALSPAPKFIVLPRFVEIALNPVASLFLNTSVAGKNNVIAKLRTIIAEADFIPFLVINQNKIIIKPEAKSLGCINVNKPKITEFIMRYCVNFLSFFSTKSFTTIASAIMKPEAAKLSYPTANELSDNVGFKRIRIRIK